MRQSGIDIIKKLEFGDILCYGARGFFGWLIRIESRQPVAHCETYAGNDLSWASRDGLGVGEYPVRLDGLIGVYRYHGFFNEAKMKEWFLKVKGQKYDWWSIVGFSFIVQLMGERARAWLRKKGQERQFCSEFCTRLSRIGGVDPFPRADADEIMPYEFTQCSIYPLFKAF